MPRLQFNKRRRSILSTNDDSFVTLLLSNLSLTQSPSNNSYTDDNPIIITRNNSPRPAPSPPPKREWEFGNVDTIIHHATKQQEIKWNKLVIQYLILLGSLAMLIYLILEFTNEIVILNNMMIMNY
jgi:hypothetical protein